ncbi:MAG: hypothetical protein ABS76_36215 [Pelagibacterium sp. SCN 64-44]|nr:MAG: hypothetical protein ABS76_36215 [Pelagibacterium sp. SCN 64-44]
MPPPPQKREHGFRDAVLGSLIAEVIVNMGRMRAFGIVAPFTARQFDEADPLARARQIGIDYVVVTRVLGDRLAFSLIETYTEAILLADHLPLGRHLERSAEELALALAAQMARSEMLHYRRTGSASAYVHYLLGTERLAYDLQSIRKARQHFQKTTSLAPEFAPALSLIARSYSYEWLVLGRNDQEPLSTALALSQQSVEMDPLGALGHWELGHANLYLRRFDEALESIQRATQRAPHLADLLADEADILVHMDRSPEAISKIEQALTLNPLAPDEYRWVKGSALFDLEDYVGAFNVLGAMRDTEPVARLLAASAAMIGDMESAATYRKSWLSRYPDFKVTDWAKLIPMKSASFRERISYALTLAGFS